MHTVQFIPLIIDHAWLVVEDIPRNQMCRVHFGESCLFLLCLYLWLWQLSSLWMYVYLRNSCCSPIFAVSDVLFESFQIYWHCGLVLCWNWSWERLQNGNKGDDINYIFNHNRETVHRFNICERTGLFTHNRSTRTLYCFAGRWDWPPSWNMIKPAECSDRNR